MLLSAGDQGRQSSLYDGIQSKDTSLLYGVNNMTLF